MNILMITENDPAGMGIAFCNAINKYSDHSCRLVTTSSRYGFNYEKDLHLPNLGDTKLDELEQLLKDADIIHFHILFDEDRYLGPIRIKDYIKGKELIHHHHGHPEFRANPDKYCEKYTRLGRKVLVSTPDLLRLVPFATWIPNLIPLDDYRFEPANFNDNDRIRLCQAPTRKDLKNTDDFISVSEELKHEYNNIDYVVIENTLYTDCLLKKKECDIHFDHMQGYYGVSSLESLSQGKPVIAGVDDFNLDNIKEFTGSTSNPWVIAKSRRELKDKLEMLICEPEIRKEKGYESRKFMMELWNERRVIQTLFGAYGIKICA